MKQAGKQELLDQLKDDEYGNFSPDYSGGDLASEVAGYTIPPETVRKVHYPDANYVEDGPPPFQCGNCRFIVWGTSKEGSDPKEPDPEDAVDLCSIVSGPHDGGIYPADSCRFFTAKRDPHLPWGGGEQPDDADSHSD